MRIAALVSLLLVGCASSHPSDPIAAPTPPPPQPQVQPAPAPTVVVAPAPPAPIHTVKFVATTLVRESPDGGKLGIVTKGTVSRMITAEPGSDGCKARWIAIAPRGWVCETAVEPSDEPPTTAAAATLDADDDEPLVTGVYGVVRGEHVQAYGSKDDAAAGTGRELVGATSVRAAGLVKVGDQRFWRTSTGELIDESAIVQISPSKFHGVPVDGELPAWVRARRDPYKPAKTYSADGAVNGELAARTIVTIEEVSEDGLRVRVGEDAWIARGDLRVASLVAPPPGTAAHEKWFDIDLDEQVLVAYEGERPVYATLVSTGKWQHETPEMIARVGEKLERAAMNSEKPGELYSVADVPWTMYFDHNYALHTSYWHDGFGGPRSHGCVNLAPRDAKLLYRWSSPDVPPGWSVVYADADNPGSLVRVRSHRVPEPAFRGYAKQLRERDLVVSR